MSDYTDEELLDEMNRVLTRVVEHRLWHGGWSISQLRQVLKTHGTQLIQEAPNPPRLTEALIALDQSKWDELVDRMDLGRNFPNAAGIERHTCTVTDPDNGRVLVESCECELEERVDTIGFKAWNLFFRPSEPLPNLTLQKMYHVQLDDGRQGVAVLTGMSTPGLGWTSWQFRSGGLV